MQIDKNRSNDILGIAMKVASVHGSKEPALIELKDVVDELLELGSVDSNGAEIAELMGKVRELTQNYEIPEWACRTVRRYYSELARLDSELST